MTPECRPILITKWELLDDRTFKSTITDIEFAHIFVKLGGIITFISYVIASAQAHHTRRCRYLAAHNILLMPLADSTAACLLELHPSEERLHQSPQSQYEAPTQKI